MKKMLKIMGEKLRSGEDLMLVTVVASSGATPRGAGARMLVGREGRIYGTIGGGAVEYRTESARQSSAQTVPVPKVSTSTMTGSATPMAYASVTWQRLHSLAATRFLAMYLAM